MPRILGRHHSTIRRIRALRDDPARRRAESVFVAEGLHLAREALRVEAPVELVVTAPEIEALAEGADLLRSIHDKGLDRVETSRAVLNSLQDARSPQPVLMLVRRPRWSLADTLDSVASPLITVAVGVQDPGNLGSLFRTADAAGSTACLVGSGCADAFHPRTVRATMGSIFRLPLIALPDPDAIDGLRRRGVRILGTAPGDGQDYDRAPLTGATALVFGGEARGIPEPWRGEVDLWVRVPMRKGVESLSVGAAAAVLLFETARQRRAAQPSES